MNAYPLFRVCPSDEILEDFAAGTSSSLETACFRTIESAVQFGKDLLTAFAGQEATELERYGQFEIEEEEDRLVLRVKVHHRERIFKRYIELREIDGKEFRHESSEQSLGEWSDEPKTATYSLTFEETDSILFD